MGLILYPLFLFGIVWRKIYMTQKTRRQSQKNKGGSLSTRVSVLSVLSFLKTQVKIRPRIRLFTVVLLALFAVFAISSKTVPVLKEKEAQVVINGQRILVAQEAQKQPEAPVEIGQSIKPRRSPFEFEKPVDNGYLSQGYSAYHQAHDIATSLGASLHPVGPGIVEFAGMVSNGKGNIVIVDHGDGLKSLYAHMGRINVGVGNMVNTKTTIGAVGMTGHTTGPHVHLEIYDNSALVNPETILP